jgi:hypothetical protein
MLWWILLVGLHTTLSTAIQQETSANVDLMTITVKIAKYVHQLYDSGEFPETKNWYHGHFVGGINQCHDQTNNYLIIEEYYGIYVAKIHTPWGYWPITGSGVGNADVMNDRLRELVKLKMICPGYQTESGGYYGPYWLVTEFNGTQLPCPDIQLLPPRHYVDVKTEGVKDLNRYLEQKNTMYKKKENYLDYELAAGMFDDKLGEWIRSGIIRDKLNISLKMLDDYASFDFGMAAMLSMIEPSLWKYINSGTINERIFKVIYTSKQNSNL